MTSRLLLPVLAALMAASCAGEAADDQSAPATTTPTTVETTTTTPAVPETTTAVTAETAAKPVATTSPPREVVDIVYVLDRRTTDEATADFEVVAESTLTDPRGWSRARFRFVRVPADAPYRIVLAEGDEVDRLCLPYDTYGKYSCQNGPVVALNADRWRSADPKWTGDLDTYRRMVVNHEVGHLLGMRHPRPQCPRPGRPAPVMNQQSTELNGCLPNPWPLDDEIAVAARHDRKLAPGPGE